ncbi:MAG: UDP-2,3-diacylglucosamine diphosphatase LpxI [Gemmataceae bacterium]|nr:UDP-2,3-diacylglucosamine diphosphatase LpxI [Gemmataceae bacterium]
MSRSQPVKAPIGLLAGSGRFPVVFAEKCRSLGIPVVCVGIRHEAPPELAGIVDRFYWAGIAKLGRIIRCFKREGAERLVMAGKIHKTVMYSPWRVLSLLPDWRMIQWWYRRQRSDNRDDTLLLGLIDEFALDGMRFESALDLCPELLVGPGIHTRRQPTAHEEKDIAFGWMLARKMGEVDVGQSVVVKERAVLAVEAIEGTDRAILRAGELCPSGGFTVVKVAKPQQDMRFDVPTIGCSTIESMHKAGGRVLAIEASKTIVIDQEQTVALANRYGIAIVALEKPAA